MEANQVETNQKSQKPRFPIAFAVIIIVASLVAGGIIGYSVTFATGGNEADLQSQIADLQQQISSLQSGNSAVIYGENVSLAQIYEQVKDSIVVVQGYTIQYDMFRRAYYSAVQGSGFIYEYSGRMVVITNNHVVEDTINNTVTFFNGEAYAASVIGSDPYADLAVLSTVAPDSEYEPLEIVSSSTLNMGDPLIAVGGPYGLAGSMTTGVVSALGRTITEESSNYAIANVIQTSTPI